MSMTEMCLAMNELREENARLLEALRDCAETQRRVINDPHWRTNDNSLWGDVTEACVRAEALVSLAEKKNS